MAALVIRIGAVADIHYERDGQPRLRSLFEEAAKRVDILLLAGDLTDYGLPEEAHHLVHDLAAVGGLPVVAVLGNHDVESGREEDLVHILRAADVKVLDGESVEIKGVGIAGIKGFGGGFGRGTLEPWGETGVKAFVRESVDESLKLERALARLRTPVKIALLHYAPIRTTVVGEPEEIFPFLGSGRFEEPLNRFGVAAAFHGHAHRGSPEGHTATGIPIYNVSLPVLQQLDPTQPPLRIIEVKVPPAPPLDGKPATTNGKATDGSGHAPRDQRKRIK
jgi:Icc-related predicted phosphoesterase